MPSDKGGENILHKIASFACPLNTIKQNNTVNITTYVYDSWPMDHLYN